MIEDFTNDPLPAVATNGAGGASPTADELRELEENRPVRALGMRGGVYWFFSPSGELRSVKAEALSRRGVTSLFNGNRRWVKDYGPTVDRNGEPTGGLVRPARLNVPDPALRRRRVVRPFRRGAGGGARRFAGTQSRAVAIPPHLLPRDDDDP